MAEDPFHISVSSYSQEIEPAPQEKQGNVLGGLLGSMGSKTKEYTRWGLYAVKTELVLYNLRQTLYWQSLIEFFLMTTSFILLLMSGKLMILMHLLHFVRPYFTYQIILKLPRSHKILEELPEDIREGSDLAQQKVFDQFKSCTRPLAFYLVITCLGGLFDLVGLLVDLTGVAGEDNSSLYYAMVAWVFLCLDFYLVFWYYTLQWTYPEEIWKNLTSLAKGGIDEVKFFLKAYFGNQQQA